ncbi:hypothetical protein Ccrd_006203 [Cynara cardunculus var. scolymus]|uniref:AWPM-19-like protein n=1 Tax=Cynara cardunculus var. scolymus TaxID=59895 RepID=A0A118JU21_CYNCS|nr:hypothetical protein Ccrd_006203 [Cynara cardunculus var. scolymus]
MATGCVVLLSLLAGVVGFVTMVTGMNNVAQWDASNLYAASASSLISWSLTRALETVLIIVTGTQLFSMIAIQSGIEEVSRYSGGRV